MAPKEDVKAIVKMSYSDFYDQESARIIEQAKQTKKETSESAIRRKVAKEYLSQFAAVPENLELVPEIKEPLEILFKGVRATSSLSPRGAVKNLVMDLLKKAIDPVNEQAIFEESLKMGGAWGRAEMKRFMRDCVNTEPQERLWIEFIPAKDGGYIGAYQVVATGPDAPTGWTGYMPTVDNKAVDL